jgi:uncharacterized protein YecT (DUF1311 family)
MKKIIVLTISLLPLSAISEICATSGNVYTDLSCVDLALDQSKKDLNAIYQKIYISTQHKDKFEQAQKAWLNYREKQCNGYISSEASQSQGAGAGLITKDCLVEITTQRVEYLKTLLDN